MRDLSFSVVLCVLLTACGGSTSNDQSSLHPDEVLARAARASSNLESATFTVQGTFTSSLGTAQTAGNFHAEGVTDHRGGQMQLKADIDVTMSEMNTENTLHTSVQLISAGTDEVYMKVDEFSLEGGNGPVSSVMSEAMIGQWWSITNKEQTANLTAIAPDPQLLHAQSEVIHVDADGGMRTVRDRRAHYYVISIDNEKMLQYLSVSAQEKGIPFEREEARKRLEGMEANGYVWIDAETYDVLRIQWELKPYTVGDGQTLQASFIADLNNFNEAPDIKIPDAKPMDSYNPFAPQLPGGSTSNSLMLDDEQDAMLQNIIQEMNSP